MGCASSRHSDNGESVYDMSPVKELPMIYVNGVPGAGNKTVAQTISSITNYTMIRPGELMRAEALKDTRRGRIIAEKLALKEDVPEQLTVDLVKEAMLSEPDAKGFILVGFPRNQLMSRLFRSQVKRPEKMVALDVDNDLATIRLRAKLSELGRPEAEIIAARRVVQEAAQKVRIVHKRFDGQIITLDSSGNPKGIASNLKEVLSDVLDVAQKNVKSRSNNAPVCTQILGIKPKAPNVPNVQNVPNVPDVQNVPNVPNVQSVPIPSAQTVEISKVFEKQVAGDMPIHKETIDSETIDGVLNL